MAIEICFDEDGDVVLNVERENPHLLRVSSKNLMCASPVFKALLGPHFREGQAKRSSQCPAEVSLPEDEGVAMIMICQQLHPSQQQSPLNGSKLDAELILRYAVLVDKYALVSTLRLQAGGLVLSWLHKKARLVYTAEMKALLKIIAASYLLRQNQAFEIATKRAIEEKILLKSFQYEPCLTFLPSSVIVALTERMTAAYAKLGIVANGGLCLVCIDEKVELPDQCGKH